MIQPTNAQLPIPQQGGANAVSINIYNPQAYGNTPTQQQQAPYTNSLYNMPESSVYGSNAAFPQQQYIQNPIQTPVTVAPVPQPEPSSVLEQPQQQQAQPIANEQPANEQPVQTEDAASVKVDTDELINELKSTDTKTREAAINKLAEYAQSEDQNVVKQVITEPIMQTLVDVISEDTSGLQGPTDEQIAVAEKVAKGEQLTPEEDKLSEELSPRDAANQNRMFALYTLAMLQKSQRDEVDEYIESQKANGQETIQPLKILLKERTKDITKKKLSIIRKSSNTISAMVISETG